MLRDVLVSALGGAVNRFRRALWPTIDDLLRSLGDAAGQNGYAAYTLRGEYIATVPKTVPAARVMLWSMGFRPEMIAALKSVPDGRTSRGSWVWRPSPYSDMQLHVHLFDNGDGTCELHGHWEYSWITHPKKHYNPGKYGGVYSPDAGREMVLDRLSDHDLTYIVEPR